MRISLIIFLIFIGLFLLNPEPITHNAYGDVGEAGTELDFMNMGAGARPAALGDAFSSLADDANSVYWNPAGLARMGTVEGTWMHSDLNFGTTFDYISLGSPLIFKKGDGDGTAKPVKDHIGFGWIRTATGDILITGISTDTIPGTNYNRVVIQGLARFLSNAFMLSYSRQILDRLSIGATAKMYDIELATNNASGYGLDLGILYGSIKKTEEIARLRPPTADYGGQAECDSAPAPKVKASWYAPLSVALVVNDLTTTRLKWSTGYVDKIAPNVRFGLSYRLFSGRPQGNWISSDGIALSCDIEQQVKTERQAAWHEPLYHLGVEWKAVNMLPLRAGYDNGDFACGIGFITKHLNLDYAYKAQPELKAVHKVAITGKL